jgi:hypothetical protein
LLVALIFRVYCRGWPQDPIEGKLNHTCGIESPESCCEGCSLLVLIIQFQVAVQCRVLTLCIASLLSEME